MPLLTLSGVSKAYDEKRPLFRDVDLTVTSTDRIGLIGANGAGKSTLLRIMAGLEAPNSGERILRRGVRVGYLEQEPVLAGEHSITDAVRGGLLGRSAVLDELNQIYQQMSDPALREDQLMALNRRQSILEHRLDEMGGHDIEHLIDSAIHGVGLSDPTKKCAELSGGERRRVALARLLVDAPDLMLLDEPTNHLDAFVISWLEKQLSLLKVPLVIVTHDRFLLDRVANRIVEVDRGGAYSYPGSYQTYLERRAERIHAEENAERVRLSLLKRETAWMRAGVLARGTKAKARQDRFHELASADKYEGDAQLELQIPKGPRLGDKVIQVAGLQFAYGANSILNNLDLEVLPNMRLGIVGPNGVGKTTLLKLLLGQLTPDAGTVVIGETVRFGTIEQNRENLIEDNSVVEEIAGKNDHVKVGSRNIHVASYLDSFLFPGENKFNSIGSLSGGERGRVLLAKLLLQDCNVLILDEPTNDLDLNTLRALEEAICAFQGCVLLVSHDRWFLDRVATHVMYLDGLGGAFLHTGDLSSLMERWQPTPLKKVKNNKNAKQKPTPQVENPIVKLSFKEKQELASLWDEIETIEQQIATIDEGLVDPSVYKENPEKVGVLQDERRCALQALELKMNRWEELAARE